MAAAKEVLAVVVEFGRRQEITDRKHSPQKRRHTHKSSQCDVFWLPASRANCAANLLPDSRTKTTAFATEVKEGGGRFLTSRKRSPAERRVDGPARRTVINHRSYLGLLCRPPSSDHCRCQQSAADAATTKSSKVQHDADTSASLLPLSASDNSGSVSNCADE